MIAQHQLEKLARLCEGILILGSLPGTAAAESGLRYGDILIEVNGVRTKNIGDFFIARESDNQQMCVVLWRDGVRLELVLKLGGRRKATLDDVREYLHRERAAPSGELPS